MENIAVLFDYEHRQGNEGPSMTMKWSNWQSTCHEMDGWWVPKRPKLELSRGVHQWNQSHSKPREKKRKKEYIAKKFFSLPKK